MDNIIEIRQAHGFGGETIWKPANDAAVTICGISRTTTLSDETIQRCEKLGFTIRIALPEPTWHEENTND